VVTGTATAFSVAESAQRRRSVRSFAADPVPREDLEQIVQTAALAPSAFNLQPWRFVAVQDAARKARLAAAAHNQAQVTRAPVVLALYTDTADAVATRAEVIHPSFSVERRERAAAAIARTLAEKTEGEREAWGAAQGYIALGFLLLAAESLGYQTSAMMGFTEAEVKAVLGLPGHVRVVALVALGRGVEEGLPHHRHPLARILRLLDDDGSTRSR
jgi:nitroreductase